MPFREYIYLDSRALYQYCAQLGIEVTKNKTVQSINNSKVGADIKLIGAGLSNEIKENYELSKTDMDILIDFEKDAISKGLFFDLNSNKAELAKGDIFTIDTNITIPDAYQQILAVTEFIPVVRSNVKAFNIPDETVSILGIVEELLNDNSRIPFCTEYNNYSVYGALENQFFIDNATIKDLQDDEVTIIAKVRSITEGTGEVVIFNFLDNGLKLKSALSNLLPQPTSENQFIAKTSLPAIRVSILAIYR